MADKLKTIDPKTIAIEKNFNCRNAELAEPIDADLVESVQGTGVMIPLHVRMKKGKAVLIAGERRLRAALKAEIKKVPVIDHGEITDAQAHDIAFAENFARKDLTAIEAGKAAKMLLAEYNGDAEAAASKLGKSVGWVKQRVRIVDNLCQLAADAIEDEFSHFTASHLQIIAAFEPAMQVMLLGDLYEDDTVEDVRDKAAKLTHCLKFAPWDITEGLGDFPACIECRFRTSIEPGLFDEITENGKPTIEDRCTDVNCWEAKKRKFLELEFEKQKIEHPGLQFATSSCGDYNTNNELAKISGNSVLTYAKLLKKDGKDRKPVLVIDDCGAGKIQFVKDDNREQSGDAEPQSGGKKTMEEKRQALESKRWSFVLERMVHLVSDFELDELYPQLSPGFRAEAVFALAAAFGAPMNCRYGRDDNGWIMFERLTGGLTDGHKPDSVITAKELFEMIKSPIRKEIFYNGPVTQVPDEMIESAKRIAAMFDIDIDGLFEKACKKYKEPKAWASQEDEEC